MAKYTFNTQSGETIAREQLIACLNTGTADAPVWSIVGRRVEDSSAEYDWQSETKKDILGDTYSTLRKPIITQSFDPCDLDSGDVAQQMIWELAIVEQDAQKLANMDMLIVHSYADFGERYESCMVQVTGEGGAGGGNIGLPFSVTYGGIRTKGSVTVNNGVVTFTPET